MSACWVMYGQTATASVNAQRQISVHSFELFPFFRLCGVCETGKCLFVQLVGKPLQSSAHFSTQKDTTWWSGIHQVLTSVHCATPSCVGVKMTCECASAQVHQLPTHGDQHFPHNVGSRSAGGAADTKPGLGDVRPEGDWPARGSQPTTGQEI